MTKLAVFVCAFLGAHFILPMLFPALNQVAFVLMEFNITWRWIVSLTICYCAFKLQAEK